VEAEGGFERIDERVWLWLWECRYIDERSGKTLAERWCGWRWSEQARYCLQAVVTPVYAMAECRCRRSCTRDRAQGKLVRGTA